MATSVASLRTIRVPPPVVPVLRKFAQLRAQRQAAVVRAMESGDQLLSISQLRDQLETVLTSFDADEVSEFVGSLLSLAGLAGSHNFEIETLAGDIAESDDLALPSTSKQRFVAALTEILRAPAVSGLARAFDVGHEHDRVVHTQRIFTDLRPVFADPTTEPLGVVITHMLRIEAVVDGRVRASTFALDSADLLKLSELIDRAKAKEASLDATIQRASLPRFIISTEDDS